MMTEQSQQPCVHGLSVDQTETESLVASIFSKSQPGVRGVSVPEPELGAEALEASIPGKFLRSKHARLPQVSQLDAVRHFIQLSQLNHCIDKDFYPLGSCTMKYNPKVCDEASNQPGFAQLHPWTPEHLSQGTLRAIFTLQNYLADITGFSAVSLQPAAGAHGELVGMMMIKAHFANRGETARNEVIVPDSAHGTNPASAVMCGFKVKTLPSGKNGLVDVDALKAMVNERTAAFMLTNPNTAGLFEKDILAISQVIHAAGGMMYYDGANLNAIVGNVRPAAMGFDVMHINTHKTFATPHGGGGPGCGPVACTEALAPFLPSPLVVHHAERYSFEPPRETSIGRVKGFWGNVDMMIRALCYLLAYGADGLAQVSRDAVLNANYLRTQLGKRYQVAFEQICKHECILTPRRQKAFHKDLNTMVIVKRLMDYGFHPPTVYFPLIVPEAMMFEPTETESKATLDRFVAAMNAIADECEKTPEVVLNAPHTTPIRRVDEVTANRQPDLNYFAQ